MRPISFSTRVETMMRETGRSYFECCRILGQHGGRAAAASRKARAWQSKKIALQVVKQEAQGLR